MISSRTMLKAVIFDMDGVLIDSHQAHRIAWRNFNAAISNPVTEGELDFVLDGRKREEILAYFLGKLSEDKMAEYGRLKDSFFQQEIEGIQPLPGLPGFLDDLRRHEVKMAVGTSASQQRTHLMLEKLGLTEYFDAIVTGTEVATGKPDPAVFRLAAGKMGVPAGHALVVEDAVAGVRAAHAAGMRCIAVASNGRSGLLREAGADRVIPDFRGLSVAELGDWFAAGSARDPRRAEGASLL